MTLGYSEISAILYGAKESFQPVRPPMAYRGTDAAAWSAGAHNAVGSFFHHLHSEFMAAISRRETNEGQEAVADPTYDRIDHLIYRAEREGLSYADSQILIGDLKRLRAQEKAQHPPKVDPMKRVVLFHGEPHHAETLQDLPGKLTTQDGQPVHIEYGKDTP